VKITFTDNLCDILLSSAMTFFKVWLKCPSTCFLGMHQKSRKPRPKTRKKLCQLLVPLHLWMCT